ncbi:A/G-specific adenine glycosylase [Zhengella mangrovi]|uniref:Adenine DNA glycosylase n=1 Tax=Zhengella mangrovi TaxID=1982044 RepID=A0A2G1QNY4_9HYPH|nr:A/G-specific adenine glycosylase [Zhengella mangrovi]
MTHSTEMNDAPTGSTYSTAAGASFSARLLGWYDRHHRDLPWRLTPDRAARGEMADPYRVWLSEVMLQQTTVPAVKPYFARFTEQWPTVTALAGAEADEIMKAWAGLGYYSRARNLKACADAVALHHGGRFPETATGLRALPGIGDYTAAAIAAIAFGQRETVVDGNVERVMTRHRAIAAPMPAAKAAVKALLGPDVPDDRPGDFAQAMMDLGATICTPRRPACVLCPLRDDCAVLMRGEDPEAYPVKAAKKAKPVRTGAAFVALSDDGAVLLEKRPDSGLLGGMAGLPTTAWSSRQDGASDAGAAPFEGDWQAAGVVSHVFTHFELRLTVWRAQGVARAAGDGRWWSASDELAGEALPTVMKKALESAIPGITKR